LEGDFQSSKPDLNRFKHDALATFRRLLQRLPTEVAELEEQVDLPESSQKSMRRIAWNVSMPGESVRIEPVVQQAKKRGDGWTKGRKVPLEQLG
jgi:hypothetical protein